MRIVRAFFVLPLMFSVHAYASEFSDACTAALIPRMPKLTHEQASMVASDLCSCADTKMPATDKSNYVLLGKLAQLQPGEPRLKTQCKSFCNPDEAKRLAKTIEVSFTTALKQCLQQAKK